MQHKGVSGAMAGRLIKQARKMGYDIPPLTRPSESDGALLARMRAKQLLHEGGPLESDEDLGKLGRLGLRHIAVAGIRESNRLKAAAALVAIGHRSATPSAPLVSLVLN